MTCDCGAGLAGPPGAMITCGHCGRVHQFAGEPPPRPEPAFPPFATARYAICQACPHRSTADTCGILLARGHPGRLWHHRGLPSPTARCPDGRW